MSRIAVAALLLLIAGVASDVSAQSVDVEKYADIQGVKSELASRPLHRVEGIWRFPYNGATVLIERVGDTPHFDVADTYRMVILRSPSRSLLPGTVMGTLSATSTKGVYSAELFTDSDGGSRLMKSKKFTLTLNGDSRLVFKSRGKKLTFQVWRMIPYLSRLYVRSTGSDATGEDGCVKIFPIPSDGPLEPIYL